MQFSEFNGEMYRFITFKGISMKNILQCAQKWLCNFCIVVY